MCAVRVLLRLRLPLAWPPILTGIRVSTQMLIGIAAIAAYAYGPGLGNADLRGARLGWAAPTRSTRRSRARSAS